MKLLRKLRSLFRKEKLDSEMTEEMQHHVELQTELNRKAGMNAEDSRYAALRQFGNMAGIQERAREGLGLLWVEQFFQDSRYALWQLRRAPGFATVVIISLALGIGANTALFSLIDDVLLRTLPVKEPHELVLLRCSSGPNPLYTAHDGFSVTDPTGRRTSSSLSYFIFKRLQAHNGPFTDLFAFAELPQLNVNIAGSAEIARGQLVSGGYFTGLGVGAAHGRVLQADDDRAGAEPVAVISWHYWQTRFGGSYAALGRVIRINNTPVTVVGITPPGFNGALQIDVVPDLTLPLALETQFNGGRSNLIRPAFWWLQIMGRLRRGVTAAAAQAEIEPLFIQAARDGWLADRPASGAARQLGERSDAKLVLVSGARGQTESRRDHRQSLIILFGIVALVLLIACVNVANLLLARAAVRGREFALRLSLGASRGRLLCQLLLESMVLALIGGAAGLLVAWWGRGALLQLRPIEGTGPLDLNFAVFGFTGGVALFTGLAFGLVPAWHATRVDLNSALKSGGVSSGLGRFALRRTLVIVQVALSVVLLVGAGLFIRTLHNLRTADTGFNRENLLLFRVDASLNGYKGPAVAALFERLLDRLLLIPGVQSAALSRHPLLGGSRRSAPITVPDAGSPASNPGTNVQPVSPGFLRTMQIPLLLGRDIDDHDTEASRPVAVVNEAFARKFFPGESALGRTFVMNSRTLEIVGIARDARYASLREPMPPTFYQPFRQDISGQANFALRTIGPSESFGDAVREAVREVDPNLPVFALRTQEAQVTQLVAQERLFALLSAFFGALALVLSCIGLYGLLAHQVTARTREIGVRMALGAQVRSVVGLVLTESVCLAVIGLVLGLLTTAALAGFIARLLYGVPATDPFTFASVAVLLLFTAVVACLLPARRAARVDPVVALRAE